MTNSEKDDLKTFCRKIAELESSNAIKNCSDNTRVLLCLREEDGKPVEFSKEAAQRVMTEHSWIREQVLEEGNNAANFI